MTKPVEVILEKGIRRGEHEITALQLRKPESGELRGLSLTALLGMDVGAIINLLPRITVPPITTVEAEQLDLADLTACALEVADFLLPANRKPTSSSSAI